MCTFSRCTAYPVGAVCGTQVRRQPGRQGSGSGHEFVAGVVYKTSHYEECPALSLRERRSFESAARQIQSARVPGAPSPLATPSYESLQLSPSRNKLFKGDHIVCARAAHVVHSHTFHQVHC